MKSFYIVLTLLLFISPNSQANWLVANNYEECVANGKGGNLQELQVRANMCRKKFPSLPSIKNGNGEVVCRTNDTNSAVTVRINKTTKKIVFDNKTIGDLTNLTDTSAYLVWGSSKKVYMVIDFIRGTFTINKDGEETYLGVCEEKG